jgi:Fur family ferric uptake transcriptional regulator
LSRFASTAAASPGKRFAVLQALCELEGHAGAESVLKKIGEHWQTVELSTVCRPLDRLRDLQILSQNDLGRGCAEYEIVTDEPDHHLSCRCCGRVIDLGDAYLKTMGKAIAWGFGFQAVVDHLAILGHCQDCLYAAQVGN